jgi:hypothetical protein
MLIKEYNLNIINLNQLIEEKIDFEIYNFIIQNELSLKLENKDTKRIFLHFIIFHIINEKNILHENIFIFNNLQRLSHLNLIFQEKKVLDFFDNLIKLIYNNFNIKILINKKINLSNLNSINFNEIYQLKNLIEKEHYSNKKKITKSKKFCEKFGLSNLIENLQKDKTLAYKLNFMNK